MTWAIDCSRKSQSCFDSKIFKNNSALAGVVHVRKTKTIYCMDIKRHIGFVCSWALICFLCLLCSHVICYSQVMT